MTTEIRERFSTVFSVSNKWTQSLDKTCAVAAALVPIGLVVGNIGFEAMIGLTVLGWIVRCIAAKENPFTKLDRHSLILPWLIWYGCILLSLMVNGPGNKGWAHDIVFVRYLLFGMALMDISKRIDISRYLIYGMAAGVLWAALNTASAYVIGYDLIGKPLTRYTGKLKEASRISGMAAYTAPFFLLWALFDSRLSKNQRIFISLIGSVSLLQVFQTHVRTSILAGLLGTVIPTIWFARKRASMKLATAIIVVLMAVSAGFYMKYNDRWHLGRLNSIYDRIYYWKVAQSMWLENPVLGVGVSSFQDAYEETATSGKVADYRAPDGIVRSEKEQTHAHNLLMMLLACTGLVGTAAFGWLFVRASRQIGNVKEGYRFGLTSWPVVLLLIGLTGFNIYHSWYQAWIAYWLVIIGAQRNFGMRITSDKIHGTSI